MWDSSTWAGGDGAGLGTWACGRVRTAPGGTEQCGRGAVVVGKGGGAWTCVVEASWGLRLTDGLYAGCGEKGSVMRLWSRDTVQGAGGGEVRVVVDRAVGLCVLPQPAEHDA